MTIEERAELAVETFAAGKGNCTQSVLCAWEDKISVDHDTLMKLGAGYGAGMGCMQATCGAVSGAVMLAGLKNSCGDLEKLADRGGEKLLGQLRTGSIEFDVDDDTLAVGDVLRVSLPQLGYTAMVRVADIITESQSSGTTRTIRLGTPSWHKT